MIFNIFIGFQQGFNQPKNGELVSIGFFHSSTTEMASFRGNSLDFTKRNGE
jgi:hypothetical protein